MVAIEDAWGYVGSTRTAGYAYGQLAATATEPAAGPKVENVNDRRSGGRREADIEQSRQIGELIGTITAMKQDFVEIREEMSVTRACVRELQSEVALKFRTAETVFKTLKVLGLIAVAILTFKLGDVRALWSMLFSG